MYTSRRCTDCSINYPNEMMVCQVCGDKTWGMSTTQPDDDWEENAARLLGKVSSESLYPHPEAAMAYRWKWGERLWFKHEDLIRAGYAYLEAGTIVFVNHKFCELEGYSAKHEAWWVSEIETEGVFENATPEDIIQAQEAD